MYSLFAVLTLFTLHLQVFSELDLDFEASSFEMWISEYPPIPLSSLDSRSFSLFKEGQGSLLKYERFLSNVSQKLYIEIHPGTKESFVKYLNLTQIYLQSIIWMPCIVLLYPKGVDGTAEAEILVFKLVAQISSDHFPLTTEVYVAFTFVMGGLKYILCDLFDYKRDLLTRRRKLCREVTLDEPMYLSEEFFGYNPVSRRRRDFKGAHLNVVAQYDPSYEDRLSIREFDNGTVEFTEGMCLHILKAMQVALNFSYSPLKGNGWMGIFPNGTWTGMSAQIVSRQADLSIAQASFVMMANQLHGISFLQASAVGQFVALFRQPTPDVNLLTSVMPRTGWILALGTWAIVLTSIAVSYTVLSRKGVGIATSDDEGFIKESLLWCLTIACQKGYYIKPSSLSLRLICLVASFLAVCIYVACSATLTGKLVTEVVPIKSFMDLANSKLEVYTDKWLPVARNLIENVYNRRGVEIPERNSIRYTIDEGVPEVIFGRTPIAFVTFVDAVSATFAKFNRSDSFFCEIVSRVKVADAKTPAGMFVRKGSPLREILNYNILMMAESGILYRLNVQYEDKTQIKCQPPSTNYRGGLYLWDLRTSYLILVGGASISIFLFVCEKLMSVRLRITGLKLIEKKYNDDA